jgi:hypothetical protein
MAGPGRPSIFSEELATRICERLAAGETLIAVCRDEEMPAESTVRAWALEDREGFSAKYARAREIGYHHMADEIQEISDNGSNDWMERNDDENKGWQVNGEHIQRSRLRVDSRKWHLSKALPKIYGDKIAHVGGTEGDPPIRTITEIRTTIVDPKASA